MKAPSEADILRASLADAETVAAHILRKAWNRINAAAGIDESEAFAWHGAIGRALAILEAIATEHGIDPAEISRPEPAEGEQG